MLTYIPLALAAAFSAVTAAPVDVDKRTDIAAVQKAAGGSLPGGPLPTTLQPAGVITLQLIAHNENFETQFFTSLLHNITTHVKGYEDHTFAPLSRKQITEILSTIIAQETLHAAGVNAALKNAGKQQIQPCKYHYPVTNYLEAITLANTFTDVVLATLPGAQAQFAKDAGDESGLVPLFGSVIGQEGEQNGFYRLVQKKTPSAAPFLTGGDANFAFNALQGFIVPDSCPTPITLLPLKEYTTLDVVGSKPSNADGEIEFAVPDKAGAISAGGFSIVYLSGLNTPTTVPIEAPVEKDGMKVFKAKFPFASKGFANGLTIAALVKGTGEFKTAADVAAATISGPGLIEVD